MGSWWSDVELWLTQLWLGFQIPLLMAVLLPVCWAVATGLDRVVDRVAQRFSRR